MLRHNWLWTLPTLANQKAGRLIKAARCLAPSPQLARTCPTQGLCKGTGQLRQGRRATLNTQMTAKRTRQQNEQARQAAEQQRVTEFEQQMASQRREGKPSIRDRHPVTKVDEGGITTPRLSHPAD